jgi:selenide, water dikinase
MMIDAEPIRLTQYSHGAGCGCKIAPAVLEEILKGSFVAPDNKRLLVGNHSKDDAAVYDLENGSALISTTDFFMPIVDDPFDFGRIASANAISDVYAMGGTPLVAIGILGWPVNVLPPAIASKVVAGAASICAEAKIPLAGGHSIDSKEPIFGLAVTGTIKVTDIKQNNTAQPGDYIFLTKRIGVGMLTTAEKRSRLLPEHIDVAKKQMVLLNSVGEKLGKITAVTAMTDVTGFGLGGHLTEVAEGSGVTAIVDWKNVPLIEGVEYYASNNIYPDGTKRNWNSYGHNITFADGTAHADIIPIVADPQTNGGILFTVKEEGLNDAIKLLKSSGLSEFATPIGRIVERKSKPLMIQI